MPLSFSSLLRCFKYDLALEIIALHSGSVLLKKNETGSEIFS